MEHAAIGRRTLLALAVLTAACGGSTGPSGVLDVSFAGADIPSGSTMEFRPCPVSGHNCRGLTALVPIR